MSELTGYELDEKIKVLNQQALDMLNEPYMDDRDLYPDCAICQSPEELKPTHDGAENCRCGSIASGGGKSHCTCPACDWTKGKMPDSDRQRAWMLRSHPRFNKLMPVMYELERLRLRKRNGK